MDTTQDNKVGELEALLADLRADDPRPRFAGTLEIRCANFMRNHGPELLRVYRAWQGAVKAEVLLTRTGTGVSVSVHADPNLILLLAGQRVRLLPDGQGA